MRSDQEVAIRMQVAEVIASYDVPDESAYTEFAERFGRVAMERLASWCTGIHASPEDMLLLAACNFDRYMEIVNGLVE